MTIRRGEPKDIPALLDFGRKFLEQTPWAKLGIDDESLISTFNMLMESKDGVLLVAEDESGLTGTVGAVKFPHYFNGNHQIAQELFWWVEPRARKAGTGKVLFMAVENWARVNKVRSLMMISIQSVPGASAVDAMYEKLGYTPAEHSFVRFF